MPFAVPFCGYGTADFGIIPDRMKEDGNQIIVYQPEGELEKESNLHFLQTGYAVDATYTTSCAPPPMMEDLGLGSVAIARPASL